ncbi:OmpA family protein [Yoonia sediminilitoris]|uniref:Outer membrane protein OmpA-like peptidoglycan-associated protein n=1 Tax=Yoonia sediminilitoris TaxID=1286148 RepID=A0A2T6KM43_9RHOB|nr:OmpA family protein [Yoonia sediminilitoris]PUB17286.1 outer membrane protein OmpA-like peptidoglycan-associated protein [Yoonia sediminilitoris]RCW97581.1 outer membrane protein OmpA-like peptidoglycan-associated protein [Yoonia sediminilitoris]
MRIFALAAIAFASFAGLSHAQELNDDELLSLFEAQRDAFREAESEGTLKTRSLTLVTVDNVQAPDQADLPTPETPVANDDLAPLTPLASGSTVTAQSAPELATPAGEETVVFARLDPALQVNLDIKFAYDSAAIDASQRPTLDRMCNVMKNSDIAVFQIVGHTDAAGSDAYNERLSRLRAEEVSRYLVSSCAISPSRLSTLGMGERFPANADNPRADENRRVEFQALS